MNKSEGEGELVQGGKNERPQEGPENSGAREEASSLTLQI